MLVSLKEIMRAWDLNPEEILTKDAPSKPNATIIKREQLENDQIRQLSHTLKQQTPKEIREEKMEKKVRKLNYFQELPYLLVY